MIEDFDAAYAGTPPWEIGRPQLAIARLVGEGLVRGRVLDAGCGTGENALLLAEHGHEVVGIDSSRRAIAKARRKAEARGLTVKFLVMDVTRIDHLRLTFGTVIDSGLFHALDDAARSAYVRGLGQVLAPDGLYHMLVWSEHEPGTEGPRRVSKRDIMHAFRDGWRVERVLPSCYETAADEPCRLAWLATVRRL